MSYSAHVKLESLSPPPSSIDEVTWSSDTDTELYWTNEELLEAALKSPATKVEVVERILENLEQLEDLSKIIVEDDDAYSQNYWLQEKMLPIYENPIIEPAKSAPKTEQQVPHPEECTQSLLMEFETVLDAVNNGAFTPPQSPPYQQQPVLTTLEPLNTIYAINHHNYPVVVEKPIEFAQPDVARELAVVDELVRTRVEIMVPSSPSSSSSSYGDCSSDEPEWSPELKKSSKTSRKRSKPYNFEDKKSRKKEQNKNAATRYRMKKKAEVEEILGEEKLLQDSNTKLEGDITDLQREIKCLKGLMRDLFKAKGLIK